MSSDIAARVAGRAHLTPGGAGWRINGSPFANATGRLNLITSAVAAFLVSQEAAAQRNRVTVLPNGLIYIATSAPINPFSDTTADLLTVPSGLKFQAKSLFVRCTAAVGVTAPCRAGAGISGGTEVYQDQSLSGLTAAGLTYRFPTGGNSKILSAGDVFALSITLPPTGTSQTLEAEAYGRLFA